MLSIIEDQVFKNIDFSAMKLEIAQYENCEFKGCNFNSQSLSEARLIDCVFKDCDLSMLKVTNTYFQNTSFESSKLLGIYFESCNPFLLKFHFRNCDLSSSTFYQLKLIATLFENCKIQDVDFTEANLDKAIFEQCDLLNTKFENTSLVETDFRTAVNFLIEPQLNTLKKTRFAKDNLMGLLPNVSIVLD